jgi:hypothetical protein
MQKGSDWRNTEHFHDGHYLRFIFSLL